MRRKDRVTRVMVLGLDAPSCSALLVLFSDAVPNGYAEKGLAHR